GEAVFDIALRLLHCLFDQPVHVDEVQAGRIGLHRIPVGAADQLVHRLAAGLADDVPQGDVDAADGGDRHAAGAVVLDAVVQVLPYHFDIEGVAADDPGTELRIDEGLGDMGGPVAFAPAHDAVLRLDLDDA